MSHSTKSNQNIMAAALELFKEKGYDSVSVNEICKKANCAVSTFYYQFPSKSALANELFSRKMAFNDERIAQVLACSSPVEQLFLIHESFMLTHVQLGLDLSVRILEYVLNSDTVFRSTGDNVYMCDLVVPIIQRAQACGEIRNPTEPKQLAEAVWVMLNGIAYSWSANRGTSDILSDMRSVLEILYDVRPDLRKASATQK